MEYSLFYKLENRQSKTGDSAKNAEQSVFCFALNLIISEIYNC